jgi:ribosome-associated protein
MIPASEPDVGPGAEASAGGGVEIAPGIWVLPSVLRFQYARSSGPGGQNVNKLNTKAELWIGLDAIPILDAAARQRLRTLAGSRLTAAGEIHLTAQAYRSQQDNRRQVLAALRELLIAARKVPRPRRKTRPSAAARRNRLESKRRRSRLKSGRRAGDDSSE